MSPASSASSRVAPILVVDDDPALLDALSDALRFRLFRIDIDTCSSGAEALQRLGSHPRRYDVILTDVRMPDLDGLTFLRDVRSLDPNVPVIVMTGYGDQDLVKRASALGAYDTLLKPFDRERLIQLLKAALQHVKETRRPPGP